MEERDSPDHLSSSLTDLMTSLMVIFILLLLVFISHTASKDAALRDVLLKELKTDLTPQGFNDRSIMPDPKDRNTILVIVPNVLMGFDNQKSDVPEAGKLFLQSHIPPLAAVICSKEFSSSIDAVVVEGHTDRKVWHDSSPEVSDDKNLKLSQDRSMAVVEEAMADLKGKSTRPCFLEKLSATGRGEQDPEKTDEDSRRVIFKIHVKAHDEATIEHEVKK